jgi:hypothetical protein
VKRLKELRICAFDQITHFLRFDVDLWGTELDLDVVTILVRERLLRKFHLSALLEAVLYDLEEARNHLLYILSLYF